MTDVNNHETERDTPQADTQNQYYQPADKTEYQSASPANFPSIEKPDGIVLPIIRYALMAIGTHYVRIGYVSEELVDMIVGGIMMLGTALWLIYVRKFRGL